MSAEAAHEYRQEEDLADIAAAELRRQREERCRSNGAAETEPLIEKPDTSILRLNRRPPPGLPLNVFGHEWRMWIEDVADAACCPADYVAGPLLAAASCLIGNARWAQAWPGWEEPPHLWVGSVGDSGDGKSPGADALFRHVLPELERRMAADFPDQHREWQAASEAFDARVEEWKASIRKIRDSNAPPLPPQGEPPPEPQSPRLRQNDVTIERVATLLAAAAPKGLLMVRDELAGFLLGMTAYNDAARPFWLEAYGGRQYRVERQKNPDPIVIPRLAVSWFGGIQPERLSEVMQEADDGLLARFCWLWPEPVPFAILSRAPGIEAAISRLDRLRLLQLQDTASGPMPTLVPLTAAAQEMFSTFCGELQQGRDLTAGLMRSTYGKARGLTLRLALVLDHLWWCAHEGFDPPPSTIGVPALEAAIVLVRSYLLPMAARTYGDAASTQAERNVATLARWIAKERPDEVRTRSLQRGELPSTPLPGLKQAEHIHAACRALGEAGWLLQPAGSSNPRGGRPPAAYPVDPRLWAHLPPSDR
jgi:hypothetical protein